MSRPPLSPQAVERVLKAVSPEGKVILVGGQALEAWARMYRSRPGMDKLGPLPSKDIDFQGSSKSAEKIRADLRGEIDIPGLDDHTPENARVRAKIGDENVSIDFMGNLVGVDETLAVKRAVTLELVLDGSGPTPVKVMHPLDAFRSRVGNVIHLGRDSEASLRQLTASIEILSTYIDDLLSQGFSKGATDAFREIHDFLKSDIVARGIEKVSPVDPLEILRRFRDDKRLHQEYRTKTLRKMIERLEARRVPKPRKSKLPGTGKRS